MNKELTERAKGFFCGDIFATEVTGIEITEADECYAKCRLALTDKHRNAGGGVMGGVIFTLADFCFAVAVNTERPLTVTASSQISFLAPVKGDELFAEAKVIKDGKRSCFCCVTVTDKEGTVNAYVTGNGQRVK